MRKSCVVGVVATVLVLFLGGAVPVQVLLVKGQKVNFRAGPGTTYAILGTVVEGEQYPIIEQSSGWYKIRLEDGQEGWISGKVAEVTAAGLRKGAVEQQREAKVKARTEAKQPRPEPEVAQVRVPGVNLSRLTQAQRAEVIKELKSEQCTCSWRMTLLECRVENPVCLELAEEIVAEIAGVKAPPAAQLPGSPTRPLSQREDPRTMTEREWQELTQKAAMTLRWIGLQMGANPQELAIFVPVLTQEYLQAFQLSLQQGATKQQADILASQYIFARVRQLTAQSGGGAQGGDGCVYSRGGTFCSGSDGFRDFSFK